MIFVHNFLLFPAVKNFENRLRFDGVIVMSLVSSFFGGHGVNTVCHKLTIRVGLRCCCCLLLLISDVHVMYNVTL